jgi:hypothetical protein
MITSKGGCLWQQCRTLLSRGNANDLDYADDAEVFFWKHSRHNTGRPCVGLNGTVVSLPQLKHTVRVSIFGGAFECTTTPSTTVL